MFNKHTIRLGKIKIKNARFIDMKREIMERLCSFGVHKWMYYGTNIKGLMGQRMKRICPYCNRSQVHVGNHWKDISRVY